MTQLSRATHSHLGWCPSTDFGFARQLAMVPLAEAEISRIAQELPVLFRKFDAGWRAMAVMSPVEWANLNVSREGEWCTSFVPALFRVYPFRLDEAGELDLWEGYTPEPLAAEGAQPFYIDGELAPRLQQAVKFLKAVQVSLHKVHRSLILLEETQALTSWDVPGSHTPELKRALTGLYAIETKRFEKLDDQLVLELFRSGGLRWLHAHLDSIHNAERFKAMAESIVAPDIASPLQPNKIEQAADILAAIAEDLGDAEL